MNAATSGLIPKRSRLKFLTLHFLFAFLSDIYSTEWAFQVLWNLLLLMKPSEANITLASYREQALHCLEVPQVNDWQKFTDENPWAEFVALLFSPKLFEQIVYKIIDMIEVYL